MKNILPRALMAALLISGAQINLQAGPLPGEVDFGKFAAPGKDDKFVEINIGQSLINLAAKFIETQEPDAGKLLRSIHKVRVNVVGLSDSNREDTESRVEKVRAKLDKSGWERIVTAQEKDAENVSIYLKARGEDAIEGLVVTVIDGKKDEAVFINIVGDIRPEQVGELGKKLKIQQLEKAGEKIGSKGEKGEKGEKDEK